MRRTLLIRRQPGLHAPPAMPNEDAYYEVKEP